MITRRSALAGLTVTGLPGAVRADGAGAAIEAVLEDKARSEHIPGLAFLAVRDGRIVHTAVLGRRDRERDLPVTLDTLFPIGSATKSFTAMAAAIANDRGRLSFDSRPHRFLPWFRMYDPAADAGVILRDMLSHRTGLRAYADLAAEPGVLTREEYVRAATSARPERPFRSKFLYSNAMYAAVGEVLGHAAQSSWEEAVVQEIFRPLGMARSRATLAGLAAEPDHAVGYLHDAAAGWRAVPPPASLAALAPAGAIAASANDMAQWLLMLTAAGRGLVSSETLARLTEPQIDINPGLSYALGWAVYDWNGLKVVEHNGGSEGICALVSFLPQRRTGFVILGNTSPNFLTRIGNAAALVYPRLLGLSGPAKPSSISTAPPPAPADARPAPDLPSVDLDTLLRRITAALGPADALQRHAGLTATGRKSYENQGVTATISLKAQAPAAREEREVWTAAGREIGRLRVFFDGRAGGQTTTFGQDAVNDDAANAAARRLYHFRPAADLRTRFPDLAIAGTGWSGEVPVVRLKAPGTEFHVGIRDFRLAGHVADGVETRFRDYREVDGEQVAFRWEIHDSLGVTRVEWSGLAFVEAVDPASFAA